MHIYIAIYSHIYPYMVLVCTQEVLKTALKHINTHEAGAYYTKLT